MSRPVILVPHNPEWRERFRELALPVRDVMGDVARRIDHVGSTSIAGLVAKPIIDIQISVDDFEPFDRILNPLESLNYRWRSENGEQTRHYFREAEGAENEVHIHVRRSGSWSEQLNLLFRDYLRTHPDDRDQYGQIKQKMAEKYQHDRRAYTAGKDPTIWAILRRAHSWTWESGWVPGESDA